MNLFVLNAGSSTLKFGFFRMPETAAAHPSQETLLARGIVESIGSDKAVIRFQTPDDRQPIPIGASTIRHASEQILMLATSGQLTMDSHASINAVGCRVVHGGARFTAPTPVTQPILNEIRALAALAPLHNPIDADAIESAMSSLPNTQVAAVFDTAFHHTLPAVAAEYAIPWPIGQRYSLRRYGFHGISHRYVSERLLECLGRTASGTRLVTCHLGNGASLCALQDGQSVDTSMGLTPLEGLVMGTRSGDIDPGLLLYILQTAGLTAKELDDMLNHQSGLLGVSGRSGDVRELEKAAQAGDDRAEFALELFAYRASKYIGAYAAALGGLDAVAFTGGIGEHSVSMRNRICRRLAFLGLRLNEATNSAASGQEAAQISADDATIKTWIIPTDEERQIAREVHALLTT